MTIQTLKNTKVHEPIRRKGMSVFPLSLPVERPTDAKIADDTLVVSELPTATVPQLQVHNPGTVPMLIPAGRVLEGGRQTRTVNVSILVPAGATITIPVSCVEAGRWHGGSMFRNSGRNLSRRARIAKERGVYNSIRSRGAKNSDQGAVWNSISEELSRRHLSSDSSLYLEAELYVEKDREMFTLVNELLEKGVQDGQTGIAIAYGDKVVGVELFTSTADLAASWEALVRTAVLDADTSRTDSDASATVADVEAFLARVAAHPATTTDGTGLGTEFHVAEADLVAHALTDEAGNLVHAYAFVDA
ncbi:MAG: ARPP-1 family domain-containing protein [Ilumatobacteraceae bacterium]